MLEAVMSCVVLVKRDFKRIKGVTGLLGCNWPLGNILALW